MNNNFITYWINLDKSIDRKEYMVKLLNKQKIKNIRIPGIDGTNKNLIEKLIKYKNNNYNNVNSDLIELSELSDINNSSSSKKSKNDNDNENKKVNFISKDTEFKFENHHADNFDKQFGCFLSHLHAIKYFLEKDSSEFCLILEDDVNFDLFEKNNLNFYETINSVVNECNNDWNIIQLSYTVKKSNALSSNPINMYLEWFPKCYGTIAYIINKSGAKKLIKNLYVNNKIIIDKSILTKYVADFYLYSMLKTYVYKIPLFSFNNNFDSIINSSKELETKAIRTINEHRNYFKIFIENALPKK